MACRYTGWLCRGMVSATTYTLVGVVNKFLTVLLNVIIWDKHASPMGLFAVCVCLLSGTLYQQAPRREERKVPQVEVVTTAPTGGSGSDARDLERQEASSKK